MATLPIRSIVGLSASLGVRRRARKAGALALSLVFLGATLAAPWAEANFWEERRQAVDRATRKTGSKPTEPGPRLARLPISLPRAVPIAEAPTAHPLPLSASSRWDKSLGRSAPAWLNSLPLAHADIQETSQAPGSSRWVVLLQDIHGQEEAQRNIAKVLEHLSASTKSAPLLVGLEGASGPMDFRPYRALADPDIVQQTADHFLSRGFIGGAQFAGLALSRPAAFIGLEDLETYGANIEAFENSRARAAGFDGRLKTWQTWLAALKRAHFSSQLLDLDSHRSQYLRREIGLKDYLKRLERNEETTFSRSPQTAKLLTALRMEESLNFDDAESERSRFLDVLARSLSTHDMESLLGFSMSYRLGHVTPGAYYQHLRSLCARHRISFSAYPAFEKYLDYVSLADSIDRRALYQEIQDVDRRRAERLFSNDRQRALWSLARDLELLEKLVHQNLASWEWQEYRTRADALRNFQNRLAKAGGPTDGDRFPWETFEAFYHNALRRDEIMADTLLKAMADRPAPGAGPAAVLVAGGFHAAGLKARLTAQGYNVLVLAPRLSQWNGAHAMAAFTRERTPLDKVLLGEKLFLVYPLVLGSKRVLKRHEPEVEKLNAYFPAVAAALAVEKFSPAFQKAAVRRTLAALMERLKAVELSSSILDIRPSSDAPGLTVVLKTPEGRKELIFVVGREAEKSLKRLSRRYRLVDQGRNFAVLAKPTTRWSWDAALRRLPSVPPLPSFLLFLSAFQVISIGLQNAWTLAFSLVLAGEIIRAARLYLPAPASAMPAGKTSVSNDAKDGGNVRDEPFQNPEFVSGGTPSAPEHPRPTLAREDWIDLNGVWQFDFEPRWERWLGALGLMKGREWWRKGHQLEKRINVPYPYQSKLASTPDNRIIEHRQRIHEVVQYKREFEIPAEWDGSDVVVHFVAVDYEATVWVNEELVGRHRGGHVPFSFNITDKLRPGEKNEISVRAVDRQDPTQPRGKQSVDGAPHDVDYYDTTGIWRAVWLERLPRINLDKVGITSDAVEGTLAVEVSLPDGYSLEVGVKDQERTVVTGSGARSVVLRIPENKLKLWSPKSPHLYDLTLRLKDSSGRVVDEAQSYTGFKSLSHENGQFLLNGEPIFLVGDLYQGYWPDSLLAAPSEEEIRRDVERIKETGANTVRVHQFVADPRFLYWCDRLGVIVWFEMASPKVWSREGAQAALEEYLSALKAYKGFVSIGIALFANEDWGIQGMQTGDPEQYAYLMEARDRIREEAPHLLISLNDGGAQPSGTDIVGFHIYSKPLQLLAEYSAAADGAPHSPRAWAGWLLAPPGEAVADGVPVLSEIGGFLRIPENIPPEEWDYLYNFYNSYSSPEELEEGHVLLTAVVFVLAARRSHARRFHPELNHFPAGAVFTQFNDIDFGEGEGELNGLFTFDRRPNTDLTRIAQIRRAVAQELSTRSVSPGGVENIAKIIRDMIRERQAHEIPTENLETMLEILGRTADLLSSDAPAPPEENAAGPDQMKFNSDGPAPVEREPAGKLSQWWSGSRLNPQTEAGERFYRTAAYVLSLIWLVNMAVLFGRGMHAGEIAISAVGGATALSIAARSRLARALAIAVPLAVIAASLLMVLQGHQPGGAYFIAAAVVTHSFAIGVGAPVAPGRNVFLKEWFRRALGTRAPPAWRAPKARRDDNGRHDSLIRRLGQGFPAVWRTMQDINPLRPTSYRLYNPASFFIPFALMFATFFGADYYMPDRIGMALAAGATPIGMALASRSSFQRAIAMLAAVLGLVKFIFPVFLGPDPGLYLMAMGGCVIGLAVALNAATNDKAGLGLRLSRWIKASNGHGNGDGHHFWNWRWNVMNPFRASSARFYRPVFFWLFQAFTALSFFEMFAGPQPGFAAIGAPAGVIALAVIALQRPRDFYRHGAILNGLATMGASLAAAYLRGNPDIFLYAALGALVGLSIVVGDRRAKDAENRGRALLFIDRWSDRIIGAIPVAVGVAWTAGVAWISLITFGLVPLPTTVFGIVKVHSLAFLTLLLLNLPISFSNFILTLTGPKRLGKPVHSPWHGKGHEGPAAAATRRRHFRPTFDSLKSFAASSIPFALFLAVTFGPMLLSSAMQYTGWSGPFHQHVPSPFVSFCLGLGSGIGFYVLTLKGRRPSSQNHGPPPGGAVGPPENPAAGQRVSRPAQAEETRQMWERLFKNSYKARPAWQEAAFTAVYESVWYWWWLAPAALAIHLWSLTPGPAVALMTAAGIVSFVLFRKRDPGAPLRISLVLTVLYAISAGLAAVLGDPGWLALVPAGWAGHALHDKPHLAAKRIAKPFNLRLRLAERYKEYKGDDEESFLPGFFRAHENLEKIIFERIKGSNGEEDRLMNRLARSRPDIDKNVRERITNLENGYRGGLRRIGRSALKSQAVTPQGIVTTLSGLKELKNLLARHRLTSPPGLDDFYDVLILELLSFPENLFAAEVEHLGKAISYIPALQENAEEWLKLHIVPDEPYHGEEVPFLRDDRTKEVFEHWRLEYQKGHVGTRFEYGGYERAFLDILGLSLAMRLNHPLTGNPSDGGKSAVVFQGKRGSYSDRELERAGRAFMESLFAKIRDRQWILGETDSPPVWEGSMAPDVGTSPEDAAVFMDTLIRLFLEEGRIHDERIKRYLLNRFHVNENDKPEAKRSKLKTLYGQKMDHAIREGKTAPENYHWTDYRGEHVRYLPLYGAYLEFVESNKETRYDTFELGLVTGKPVELINHQGKRLWARGSFSGAEAAGLGIAEVARLLKKQLGLRGRRMTVALQGYGNVGLYAALEIAKSGDKVVRIIEHLGGPDERQDEEERQDFVIIEPLNPEEGIPGHVLLELFHHLGNVRRKRARREPDGLYNFQKVRFIRASRADDERFIETEADVLIPLVPAPDRRITEDNAHRVKARAIVPGRNVAVTPEAADILTENGIELIAYIQANGPADMISEIEVEQNRSGKRSSRRKIERRLKSSVRTIFKHIRAESRRHHIPMWLAAYIVSLEAGLHNEQGGQARMKMAHRAAEMWGRFWRGRNAPAEDLFLHGIRSVDPYRLVKDRVKYDWQERVLTVDGQERRLNGGKVYVVGMGKGAADMARALHEILGDAIVRGQVNALEDASFGSVNVTKGGHPIPDEKGIDGVEQMIEVVRSAEPGDLVIAVVTGGGSALAGAPEKGLDLAALQDLTEEMLNHGLDIGDINAVRGSVEKIKAGKLRKMAGPGVSFLTLAVSDVPTQGDLPSVIASGPTVTGEVSVQRTRNILDGRKGLWEKVPVRVKDWLESESKKEEPMFQPAGPVSPHDRFVMLATNDTAVQAMAREAAARGYDVMVVPGKIHGNVTEAAEKIRKDIESGLGRVRQTGRRVAVLWGGEPTVHVTAKEPGKGGRNSHLALLVGQELRDLGLNNVLFLSGATDGLDGNSGFAGAVVSAEMMKEAASRGFRAEDYAARFDSARFFEAAGGALRTGATGANVADVMVALIEPGPESPAAEGRAAARFLPRAGGKLSLKVLRDVVPPVEGVLDRFEIQTVACEPDAATESRALEVLDGLNLSSRPESAERGAYQAAQVFASNGVGLEGTLQAVFLALSALRLAENQEPLTAEQANGVVQQVLLARTVAAKKPGTEPGADLEQTLANVADVSFLLDPGNDWDSPSFRQMAGHLRRQLSEAADKDLWLALVSDRGRPVEIDAALSRAGIPDVLRQRAVWIDPSTYVTEGQIDIDRLTPRFVSDPSLRNFGFKRPEDVRLNIITDDPSRLKNLWREQVAGLVVMLTGGIVRLSRSELEQSLLSLQVTAFQA